MSDDRELRLELGTQRAVVSTYGGALRSYSVAGRDVLWGYGGGVANKRGGQGDVLMPFPGRVRDGRYRFRGGELQLRKNDKDGPNAIHGFLRAKAWELAETSPGRVVLRTAIRPSEFEGYPFALDVGIEYSLTPEGLRCAFEMTNAGPSPAPVGAGFHPYLAIDGGAVDDALAELPCDSYVEFGPDLLPTGRELSVAGTALDFRGARRVGPSALNVCYSGIRRGPDGIARARVDGRELWFDAAFPYLVVFTGDTIPAPGARRALAVEPMTCATDAFNNGRGLRVLAPRERLTGSWGVRAL